MMDEATQTRATRNGVLSAISIAAGALLAIGVGCVVLDAFHKEAVFGDAPKTSRVIDQRIVDSLVARSVRIEDLRQAHVIQEVRAARKTIVVVVGPAFYHLSPAEKLDAISKLVAEIGTKNGADYFPLWDWKTETVVGRWDQDKGLILR